MMRRLLAPLLALLLAFPVMAANRKPIVIGTSGQQQQIQSGDVLVDPTGTAYSTASGTVTTTGSPAAGNLTKFSGALTITNGDLSGDCVTVGTLVSTCSVTSMTGTLPYARLPSQAASSLLGRDSAGAGVPEVVTIGSGLSMSAGAVLSATGTGGTVTSVTSSSGDLTVATGTTTPVLTVVSAPKWTTGRTITLTGDTTGVSGSFDGSGALSFATTGVQAAKWTTARTLSFTGDVTGSGSVDGSAAVATALTVASHAVTFAKFNQGAANTVVTNGTSATADFTAYAMPSCSASTSALIWTANTGFGCQSPVPATSANPFGIGPADVGSGDGVTGLNCTSTTALPEGSICMETDTGQPWATLLPSTLVPTYVQVAAASATYAVTLGATPVPGDFLIASCYRYGSLPTQNTGWFSKATYNSTGGNDTYIRVVTKLVQVGETTAQTPCTGTDTNSYSVAMAEVSGLDMVNFNNSLATSVSFVNATGTGAITATKTYTTTETNNLGVAMFGMTTANSNNAVSMSFNAGWLHTTTSGNNTLARGSGAAVASQAFTSSSSSVTASGTGGNSVFSQEGLTLVLIMLKQPVSSSVGQQRISLLDKVYNQGVQISPSNLTARSLNFSSRLTASDDGNGAVTITSDFNPASPSAIGNTTPGTGAFTTLSASSTVSGTGFSSYLASPPAIGGTAAAAGKFTTLEATSTLKTNVTGVAANCLRADTSGNVSGAGADCATGGSGTVTSVTCNGGLTGGAITTSGTCSLNSPTAHGVLIGEGSSAIAATSAGTQYDLLVSGGASADPSFASRPREGTVTKPVMSDYAWINQASGTTGTDYGSGVQLHGSTSQTTIAVLKKSAPGTPFSVYMRMDFHTRMQQYPSAGIILRNSSNGRLLFYSCSMRGVEGVVTAGNVWNISLMFERFSSATAYNANTAVTPGSRTNCPKWLRADVTSTTVTVYESEDGIGWDTNAVSGTSETISTYLTASGGSLDEIGFGLQANSTIAADLYVTSFGTTAPN